MSSRIFEYDGDQWKATAEGVGTGVRLPDSGHYLARGWSVQFECISDLGKVGCRGDIWDPEPANLDDNHLRQALKRAIEKG